MNDHLAGRIAVAVALALGAGTAWPQGLDADAVRVFGGTYRADCGDAASARATVRAQALVFENRGMRITGGKVQAAASWYGPEAPPDYRVALVSELPGGRQMLFVMYEDGAGHYLTLDGDPALLAAIGKPLAAKKFRRCGTTPTVAAPPPQAARPQLPRKYALTELSASGILDDPQARAAYHRALGPLVKERWLAELNGPSPLNKQVRVAGADYLLASACKNHDCAANNLVLLYSAERGTAYGKVLRRGRASFIGAPPPALARELDRLWREAWRRPR